MRTRTCLAAAALTLGCLAVQAQEITEDEALRRFSEQGPEARALQARVPVARAEARVSAVAPNPTVGFTREDAGGSTDQFLTAEQTLPLSGRLGLLKRAGEAATSSTRAQVQHDLLLLRGEVRLAFYSLFAGQQREATLREATNQLQEVVRVLHEREQAGESSGYDSLRAERELADMEAEFVTAQADVAQVRARLAALIGSDSQMVVARGELTLRSEPPALEALLSRALAVRSDIGAQVQQIERYEFERRAAERQRIPEPAVGGGLKRVTTPGFRDDGFVASVSIPLPLFNRGQAEAARARAQSERTRAELVALRKQVTAAVAANYAGLRLRRKLAVDYTQRLGSASAELSRIARLSYEEGERGILELLDGLRVAVSTRIRALDLMLAAKTAEVELDRAVGEEVLP